MRQQEVGEHLEPSHRVQVRVELHQGLGLVVGQPDGGDALKQRNGHCQGEAEFVFIKENWNMGHYKGRIE